MRTITNKNTRKAAAAHAKMQAETPRNEKESIIIVHNLLILDESGSMNSIYRTALSGCNETIESICNAQQRYENQSHRLSFVTFNSNGVKTILDDVPIAEARRIRPEDYHPVSCTPLYDAIGKAVYMLEQKVKSEDRVLVTVITDGEENDSKEYSRDAINEMANRLRQNGWTFALIGANQDADEVARTLSIRSSLTFEATEEGTETMYKRCRKGHNAFFDRLAKEGRDMVTYDDLPF